MKITSIELREIRLPLIHFFETSFGRTTERRIIRGRDITEPPVVVSTRGTLNAPERPGIDFEINVKRITQLTARKETISS